MIGWDFGWVPGIEAADYDVWGIRVTAGANYFVTGTAPTGLFVGAWVRPGYSTARIEDTALALWAPGLADVDKLEGSTLLLGVGAHAGYRVPWGPVVITPRVGIGLQFPFGEISESIPTVRRRIPNLLAGGVLVPWSIDLSIAF